LAGIALSQGRAAFGGAVVMVLVWALLQPRAGGLRRRTVAVLAVAAVVVGVSAATFQERFAQDPGGGARGQLTAVALGAIRARPLSGTGPNAYVSVVGRSDELTSTGVPVHDVFLLAAAELGVPGAILLLVPFAALWAAAWRRRRRPGRVGGHARACVASLPLAVILGWTGWGLLETSVFMVFCYVSGYFWGNMAAEDGEGERPRLAAAAAR
jgi:O-antigen ligase